MDDEIGAGFRFLYEDHADRVLAYALRRVPEEDAADVVSETFLTAWRRADDIPTDPLPWLFGVARRTVANRRRSLRRRAALRERVEGEASRGPRLAPDPADQVESRMAVSAALGRLSGRDREALMLVAWDGLDAERAAATVGSTPAAFVVRLHRARRRLARELAKEFPGAGHVPGEGTPRPTQVSEEAT